MPDRFELMKAFLGPVSGSILAVYYKKVMFSFFSTWTKHFRHDFDLWHFYFLFVVTWMTENLHQECQNLKLSPSQGPISINTLTHIQYLFLVKGSSTRVWSVSFDIFCCSFHIKMKDYWKIQPFYGFKDSKWSWEVCGKWSIYQV